MRRIGTSVAITDPFVKYQALLASGVYAPDPGQRRLARHLQKIYIRLKDYTPPTEYRARLRHITQAVDTARRDESDQLAVESHPIRRNPLFEKFFRKTEGPDSLALTKLLTGHQAAVEIDSPRGLFLSGDVGTGKSMLLDLLADGLPTAHKRRWHFNTFVLHTFSRLEEFRRRHASLVQENQEYSLLWIAKEMVEKSPILFLDEFQLPDRAASKLLSHLFIIFFQLGGVLVASSNRMPEELEKAIGVQYSPPLGGLFKQISMFGKRRSPGELYGETSDFAAFLEVLKARCDFWQMEGARDWRRREAASDTQDPPTPFSAAPQTKDASSAATNPSDALNRTDENFVGRRPAWYVVTADPSAVWGTVESSSLNMDLASVSWGRTELVVYGRKVAIPRHHEGVTYWRFEELVGSFGPADYISLASNYHTFIIDNVPVLTLSKKNEARRFITLLDALYESRCKLIVQAAAGPDDLFFPDTRTSTETQGRGVFPPPTDQDEDTTYSETVAEVFQDQMSPFRPNVSTYHGTPNSRYDPDQDSDFGLGSENKVDFSNVGAFTGEDERFAYKRASSRLWELCSSRWHARTSDWWQPLPADARHWEGTRASEPLVSKLVRPPPGDVIYGPSVELDEPGGLLGPQLAYFKNMKNGLK